MELYQLTAREIRDLYAVRIDGELTDDEIVGIYGEPQPVGLGEAFEAICINMPPALCRKGCPVMNAFSLERCGQCPSDWEKAIKEARQ